MKKLSFCLLVLMIASVAFMLSAASAAETSDPTQGEKVTIKIAHVSQAGVPIDVASLKLGEELNKKTGGRITVQVFPASALGNNTELLEQLQMGTLEMAISSVAFLGAFTDSTKLLDLPYLFESDAAAEEVLDGPVGQKIFAQLEPAGFKGVAWLATGWRHVTSNKEVRKPEDLKGQKIRVMENQMHIDHFNALGASAVPMAFSELYTALQNKTMDAEENPFANIRKYITINGEYIGTVIAFPKNNSGIIVQLDNLQVTVLTRVPARFNSFPHFADKVLIKVTEIKEDKKYIYGYLMRII